MNNFMLNLFLLIRPILSIDTTKIGIPGINFEMTTIMLNFLLSFIVISNIVNKRSKAITMIELSFIILICWCFLVSFLYFSETDFKILTKWILPPVTYFIFRRAFKDRYQYWLSMKWILVGFSVPVFISTYLILSGAGLWNISYITGLSRYSGGYSGPHEMSHSMGLFVMLSFLYLFIGKINNYKKIKSIFFMYLMIILLMALYCIYKGYVRTVYVGIFVFIFSFLMLNNKKLFFISIILLGFLVVDQVGEFSKIFHDVPSETSGKIDFDAAGSGRPFIWKRNFEVFSMKSFDHYIAGVGIGNFERTPLWNEKITSSARIWNSHNDFLETLFELGIVGLISVLYMYYCIYKSAMNIDGRERYLFYSLLNAVIAMNILSNSYISRFSIAQIFFIILVYLELPEKRYDKGSTVKMLN